MQAVRAVLGRGLIRHRCAANSLRAACRSQSRFSRFDIRHSAFTFPAMSSSSRTTHPGPAHIDDGGQHPLRFRCHSANLRRAAPRSALHYHYAIVLILLACLFDALDGRVARMGGTESPFGRELDSLADIVSFGVAPALLVHDIVLKEIDTPKGHRLADFLRVPRVRGDAPGAVQLPGRRGCEVQQQELPRLPHSRRGGRDLLADAAGASGWTATNVRSGTGSMRWPA
jgi:hypothetical protein